MKACVVETLDEVRTKVTNANLNYPLVVKVQIPIGKRGKAGGIRFADDISELESHVSDLLHKELLGYQVNQLLIVEKAFYNTEWYLSVMLDRERKQPLFIFSSAGGMDIEETAKVSPEKIVRLNIDPLIGVTDYHSRYLLSASGLDLNLHQKFHGLVNSLYQLFNEYGCLLCEINPLVFDSDQNLIAIDGKVEIDDSALARLPDMLALRDQEQDHPLVKEARSFGFLYIPIEPEGKVAVMSNGSGMLMSCIDLISKEGYPVAAALDLGGGPTADRIRQAIRILFSSPGVDVVLINIFGGITRCDEVAKGIELAWPELDKNKRLVLRLEGTNKEQGMEILANIEGNISSAPGLREAVKVLVEGME